MLWEFAKKFESSLGYPGLYNFFRKEPREKTRDNQTEMLTDQYMQSMMIALPIRKKKKSLLADGRKNDSTRITKCGKY